MYTYIGAVRREKRARYRHILREFLRSGLHIIIIVIYIHTLGIPTSRTPRQYTVTTRLTLQSRVEALQR